MLEAARQDRLRGVAEAEMNMRLTYLLVLRSRPVAGLGEGRFS